MLEALRPTEVFGWFEALCGMPHGSGNTGELSQWCLTQARAMGLECEMDYHGNVLVGKAGTAGQGAPVLLQSHLDMVCACAPGCGRDLSREGPELCTDGSRVWAQGTSLGADDGIGVAMMLALLASPELPHPPLECLFTVDEETGMAGAMGLDPAWITARRMINLDAECDDTLWVGCAGGNTAVIRLPVVRTHCGGGRVRLSVSGLAGGHSGVDIDKGRANAILLLGRALQLLGRKRSLRLIHAESRGAVNAIPSSAWAELRMDGAHHELARAGEELQALFRREYAAAEPGLHLTLAPSEEESGEAPMDEASTSRAICLLTCSPNGVQERFPELDTPQTSLNLGEAWSDTDSLTCRYCIRSHLDSQTAMLNDRLAALAGCLGAEFSCSTGHPAWEYRRESPLCQCAGQVYQELFGASPRVAVTHGGAECGVLAAKIPDMDCIAIGPTIRDVHTPQETLYVESVARAWRFLTALLDRLSWSSCR